MSVSFGTLFRHILNLPDNIPANQIMLLYFSLHKEHASVKNHARTSLLHLLQEDLKRCEGTHHIHLETTQNLAQLQLFDKKHWDKLVDDILGAIRQEWKVKDEEHEARKAMLAADAGKDSASPARKKARKDNKTGKTGTKSSKQRGQPKKHIEEEEQEHQPIKRSRSKKRGRPKKHIEEDAQEHQPTKRSRRTKNS